MLSMGKSTISTGPCSIANWLPKGMWFMHVFGHSTMLSEWKWKNPILQGGSSLFSPWKPSLWTSLTLLQFAIEAMAQSIYSGWIQYPLIACMVDLSIVVFCKCLPDQWEFQDPKMEVLYHIRPYFVGIFPIKPEIKLCLEVWTHRRFSAAFDDLLDIS